MKDAQRTSDGPLALALRPVTPGNRETAAALAVAPGQERFVEPVRECLAEADRLPLWRPLLLLDGETAVGFAMVGRFRLGDETQVWFDRLLIDRRHQGRGYGRAAVEAVLALLRHDYPGEAIRLSVYAGNEIAIRLYGSFGFAFNGELDTKGERVMVLRA